MPDFDDLEKILGINFKNKELLHEALTHRSYLNEAADWKLPHNERLEFLGDAVLELAVTEHLYSEFPKEPEGKLTVLRAALVNYQILAKIATQVGLQNYILMSRGERSDSSKALEVILANAIEAVIGAIYLDSGYEAVKGFVDKFILPHLVEVLATRSYRDPKSELQEIMQEGSKVTPTYTVLEEKGPAHDKMFKIGVFAGDSLLAEGAGSSKQEAETNAAREALRNLEK